MLIAVHVRLQEDMGNLNEKEMNLRNEIQMRRQKIEEYQQKMLNFKDLEGMKKATEDERNVGVNINWCLLKFLVSKITKISN